MRESRKSKGVSMLCCGFLNESCIWCACGWEMEAEDELLREEGAVEPASAESRLQEAPVPTLPALRCHVPREEGDRLGL